MSENQFSAGSILHPSDHFSFDYGYILSKFHVCCESEKKKSEIVHMLYSVSFWFLASSSYTVFLMGNAANGSLQDSVSGLPGVSGASTSINLK